jgi:hypothetical protein
MMRIRKPALVIMAATAVALPVSAQVVEPSREMVSHPKIGGSQNVKIMSHIPLGGFFQVSDIELEQEMERPYAYVSQMLVHGFTIVDLKDPEKAKVLYRFRIENAPLHQGTGGMDGKYFKHKGKYYYVQSFQFGQGGPDSDLGAIVFDVTGLPDATKVKEVARIRDARAPGGFHNIFAYKHSSGRPLLVTTVGANRGAGRARQDGNLTRAFHPARRRARVARLPAAAGGGGHRAGCRLPLVRQRRRLPRPPSRSRPRCGFR